MTTPPRPFQTVLDSWSPAPEQVTGVVAPWPAEALAALLGTSPPTELPPLWNDLYLHQARPVSALGPDGHPASSALVPPLTERRRMFGGGRVDVVRPLRTGETATRTSSVRDVRVRQGRSGWLLLMTEVHELSVAGEPRVRDERDIVYRAPDDVRRQLGERPGESTQDAPSPDPTAPSLRLDVDERTLFCFSALTYNPHRIHYDRRYATDVEGYADLLVHGPLLVIAAVEAARQEGDRDIAAVTYRLVAPSHPGRPIEFRASDAEGVTQVDGEQDGQQKVQVSVRWR